MAKHKLLHYMIGTSKHLEKNEQNPIKKSLFIVKGRPSQGIASARLEHMYMEEDIILLLFQKIRFNLQHRFF